MCLDTSDTPLTTYPEDVIRDDIEIVLFVLRIAA